MKSLPDISASALAYFQAHVEDEPEDYAVFKGIIDAYVKEGGSMPFVRKGAVETLEERSRFFDRIKERLDSMK